MVNIELKLFNLKDSNTLYLLIKVEIDIGYIYHNKN